MENGLNHDHSKSAAVGTSPPSTLANAATANSANAIICTATRT